MLLCDLLFGTTLIRVLQDLFAPQFTSLFNGVTLLGSDYVLATFAAVVYWCYDKKYGRLLTYALLFGTYLNFYLKLVVPSPRPPIELRLSEYNETSYGFPSGHAQDSTTFWTLTCSKLRKRTLTIVGSILVAGIGVSRIYLGLHTPFQVIGGFAVGLAYSALALLIIMKFPKRNDRIQTIPHLLFSTATLIPLLLAFAIFGVVGDAGRIAGYLLGFSVGALFEDRYVSFEARVTGQRRLVRITLAGAIGLAMLVLLSIAIRGTDPASSFVYWLILGFTVVVLIPAAFKRLELHQ